MTIFDAGRIHKNDIKPTLEYVAEKYNIKPEILLNNVLGSTGKQKTSGDIDIAMSDEKYTLEFFANYFEYKIQRGLNLTSILVEIKGDHSKTIDGYNGYVQIDFFIGNVKWMKFAFHSPGDESEYKGKYRTALIASMVAYNVDYIVEEDGVPIVLVGPVFNNNFGVETRYKYLPKKKNGVGYTKTYKKLTSDNPLWQDKYAKTYINISSPERLVTFLFNKRYPINIFDSFESLRTLYYIMSPKKQEVINEIFKKRIGVYIEDVPKIIDETENIQRNK